MAEGRGIPTSDKRRATREGNPSKTLHFVSKLPRFSIRTKLFLIFSISICAVPAMGLAIVFQLQRVVEPLEYWDSKKHRVSESCCIPG